MRLRALAVLLALSVPFAAHADTFTIQNGTTTQFNGTLSGTVEIDTVAGVITGSNISYTSSLGTATFTGEGVGQGMYTSTSYVDFFQDSNDNVLALLFHASSLVGFQGGALCSNSDPCDGFSGGYFAADNTLDQFETGTLEAAATPEPSSLALLGTGVLGVVGAARRRFV